MGWSIGFDEKNKRDIGYGVPAVCDHPGCNKEIDRGLSFVCGGEPYGGDDGCGLFFCDDHRDLNSLCDCCANDRDQFPAKPDLREWVEWKLTDESWRQWRVENSALVETMRANLKGDPDWIDVPSFLRRAND